ncbi:MAG: glycosyltransferase family A protein [Oscillospiraceae bacterium]|nr:glycosyltransferase family A protein [Oscillospiraceae bacterium]
MDEQEYLQWLEKIEALIGKKLFKQAAEMLGELEPIKPTRLKWYLVKARLYAAQKKWAEAVRLLEGKCDWYGEAPEREEYLELLRRCYQKAGLHVFEKWAAGALHFQPGRDEGAGSVSALPALEEAFLQRPEDPDVRQKLYRAYFEERRLTQAAVFSLLCEPEPSFLPAEEKTLFIKNRQYLLSWLSKEGAAFFFFVDDGHPCADLSTEAVTLALYLLGKPVYWIGEPVDCELEDPALLEKTVEISLANAQDHGIATLYRPVLGRFADGMQAGNETLLIDTLARPYQAAFLLGKNKGLECLQYQTSCFKNLIWRLSPYEDPFVEEQMGFAALGGYTAYKSAFYGFDVEKAIEAPAQCDFSIVIPARDSARTLRDTLKTCFDQTYKGSFEVVVSDNSVKDDGVEKLCREMDEPRLRYCRVPFPMDLTASFEYAFLQARGEFVLAIGSDDGILPWALEYLEASMKKLPGEEIFFWPRGLYVWPDFVNPAQRNQLSIPAQMGEEAVPLTRYSCESALLQLLAEPQGMYWTPVMYINSGFRRRYLKTLLECTGHLWNGTSQDIYMGIQNLLLYEDIYQIGMPLTLAGMSSLSIGGNEGAGTSKYRDVPSCGEVYVSEKEREIPITTNDQRLVYSSAFRLMADGVMKPEEEEKIPMEKAFTRMLLQISPQDAQFEVYLHRVLAAARRKAPQFLKKAQEELLPAVFAPRLAEEGDREAKCYRVELTAAGLMVDASDFGVENIAQAVNFAEKVLRGARKNKNGTKA